MLAEIPYRDNSGAACVNSKYVITVEPADRGGSNIHIEGRPSICVAWEVDKVRAALAPDVVETRAWIAPELADTLAMFTRALCKGTTEEPGALEIIGTKIEAVAYALDNLAQAARNQ